MSTALRNAILALTLALAATEQLRAATPKTPPADVGPGRVAWFDITTTSLLRSKEFYGKLFDWQFAPVQGTDQAAEIIAGGTPVGTIRVAEGKISTFNGVVIEYPELRPALRCRKIPAGRAQERSSAILPTWSNAESSRCIRTPPRPRWPPPGSHRDRRSGASRRRLLWPEPAV